MGALDVVDNPLVEFHEDLVAVAFPYRDVVAHANPSVAYADPYEFHWVAYDAVDHYFDHSVPLEVHSYAVAFVDFDVMDVDPYAYLEGQDVDPVHAFLVDLDGGLGEDLDVVELDLGVHLVEGVVVRASVGREALGVVLAQVVVVVHVAAADYKDYEVMDMVPGFEMEVPLDLVPEEVASGYFGVMDLLFFSSPF